MMATTIQILMATIQIPMTTIQILMTTMIPVTIKMKIQVKAEAVAILVLKTKAVDVTDQTALKSTYMHYSNLPQEVARFGHLLLC